MNSSICKSLLLLLLLGTLYSCEDFFASTIEIDVPEHEKRLSVGAIFANDLDIQRLYVNNTVGINESITEIDGSVTEVKLIHRNSSNMQEEFFFNYEGAQNYRHNYESDKIPPFIDGDTYILMVSSEGLAPVESEVIYKGAVTLDSILYDENGGVDLNSDRLIAFDLYFQDPPGEKNYYRAEAVSGTFESGNKLYFSDIDPNVAESSLYNSVLISDSSFDGEYHHLRISASKYNIDENRSIEFMWSSISEEQYNYDRKLNQFFNIVDNPFASPYSIGGNISGGEGLFAIESRVFYTIN